MKRILFWTEIPPLNIGATLIILVGIFCLSVYQTVWRYHDDYKLTFYDMRLGDASLIRTPAGKNILIDTGAGNEILSKLSQALSPLNHTIDLLVLSHNDADHIEGAEDILRQYTVQNIFLLSSSHTTKTFTSFLEEAKAQNIPIFYPRQGEVWRAGNLPLEYVFPFSPELCKQDTSFCIEGNNDSQVFLAHFPKGSVLFTGDIPKKQELHILLSGANLKSSLLKLPHHGSSTSSSESFLKAVSPQLALALAHKGNPYGHPHKEVIDRLQKLGIPLLQTGIAGDSSFSF